MLEKLQKRKQIFVALRAHLPHVFRLAPKLAWGSCLLVSLAFCITQVHSEERLGARSKSSSPPAYYEIRLDENKERFKATLFVAVSDSSIVQNEDSLKTMIREISWRCMQEKFPRATLVIAFLSKKKGALPKSKDEIKTWKADYLAKYDAWEKELIFFPENPKKRRIISFDLCPDAKEAPNRFYRVHCQDKKPWEK